VHVVAFANSLVQNFLHSNTLRNKKSELKKISIITAFLAWLLENETPMACTSRSHDYEDRVQFGMPPSSNLGTGGKDLPPCKAQSSPMICYAVSCNLQTTCNPNKQQNPKTAPTCNGAIQAAAVSVCNLLQIYNGFVALQMIGVG